MTNRVKKKSIESTTRRIIEQVEAGDFDYYIIEHMIESLVANRIKYAQQNPTDKLPSTGIKRQANMVDGGKVPIEVVFKAMDIAAKEREKYMVVNGSEVTAKSSRYVLFKTKGTTCVTCALEASYFRLERFPNDARYHLNLYGVDHTGAEVLFTKDHIRAKANGGKNTQKNYQTMCSPCNHMKADS